MSDRSSKTIAALLREARDFVAKSRCSVGHAINEIWDRAKEGPRHCLYCAHQVRLYGELTAEIERAADEPSVTCIGCQESDRSLYCDPCMSKMQAQADAMAAETREPFTQRDARRRGYS